jgi:5S rRNA maturation endonuclease (ribonuclease M5)
MRVESGTPTRNGGWLHKDDSDDAPPMTHKTRPVARTARLTVDDVSRMWRGWKRATTTAQIVSHAEELGVEPLALHDLKAVWAAEHDAWAYPMRDGDGNALGIRLRSVKGDKWAVKGSRAGLFIPQTIYDGPLYICEGPTDTAAALSMGLSAIGRPSCAGNEEDIVKTVKRLGKKEVVIIADHDEPGLRGAERLTKSLPVRSVTWFPMQKDIRQHLIEGCGPEMIWAQVKDRTWHQP